MKNNEIDTNNISESDGIDESCIKNPTYLMDDTLFQFILNEIPEFKEYITGFDDLGEKLDGNLITPDMRKKILDSLFRRLNNEYVNIEHQTSLNTEAWIKCLLYYALLENRYGGSIRQFIFYTGELTHIQYYSFKDFNVDFNPYLNILPLKSGKKVLKRVHDKLDHDQILSPVDIIELIWLVRFDNDDRDKIDILKEILAIIPRLKYPTKYIHILQYSTAFWLKKFINKKEDNKILEKEMAHMNLRNPTVDDVMLVAKFDNMLASKNAEIKEQADKIKELEKKLEKIQG